MVKASACDACSASSAALSLLACSVCALRRRVPRAELPRVRPFDAIATMTMMMIQLVPKHDDDDDEDNDEDDEDDDDAVDDPVGRKVELSSTRAWCAQARECLEECLRLRPSDGPSRTILRYIQEHAQPDGSPPQSWGGFRPLDSK